MILFSSFSSVISRENGLISRLSFVRSFIYWGEGTFIRRERLKEGDVHKLFLILGGAFIGWRRLKEGGRLLEDLSQSLVLIATKPSRHLPVPVKNRNIRTRCEICSKLTIKTLERSQWRHSGVFIVNTLNIFHTFS